MFKDSKSVNWIDMSQFEICRGNREDKPITVNTQVSGVPSIESKPERATSLFPSRRR